MPETSRRRRGGRRSSCASTSARTTSALPLRHPTGVKAAQPPRAAAATGWSRSCGGSPTSLSNVDSQSVREMARPVCSEASTPSDHALYVPTHSTSVASFHGLQAKSAISPAATVRVPRTPSRGHLRPVPPQCDSDSCKASPTPRAHTIFDAPTGAKLTSTRRASRAAWDGSGPRTGRVERNHWAILRVSLPGRFQRVAWASVQESPETRYG
jgi:hypothetical protein